MHSKLSTTSSVSLDSQRTVCGLLYSINNLYVLQAERGELEQAQRQASLDLQQQQQAQQQAEQQQQAQQQQEEEKEEQEEQEKGQQQAQQRLTQEGSGLEAQACRGEGSLDLAAPRAGE